MNRQQFLKNRFGNIFKKPENKPKEDEKNQFEKKLFINTHPQEEEEDILISEENHSQLKEQIQNKKKVYLQIGSDKEKKFILEVSQKSFKSQNTGFEISIQRRLTNLFQIQLQNHKFEDTIKQISQQEIETYALSFVEVSFKDQFISRRDLRNIDQHLDNMVVYTNKIINYNGMRLLCMNMMKNDKIVYSGFITSQTKKIYRSQSSRYSVLIEINKEIFEFDGYGEIYWEKVYKFLRVFFSRCLYFNTNHNLDIIFYGRLFYPQFNSLEQAYKELLDLKAKDSGVIQGFQDSQSCFQMNNERQVFQDVYRKTVLKLGQKNIEKNLSQIWHAFNEFLCVINWKKNVNPITTKIIQSYNQYLSNSDIHQSNSSPNLLNPNSEIKSLKINTVTVHQESSSKQVKRESTHSSRRQVSCRHQRKIESYPIECELSYSYKSNFLEALSVVSMQFTKHYISRSLTETGHNIINITCGDTRYYSDQGLYKMLKNLLLLHDIRCTQVSLRETYASQIATQIIFPISPQSKSIQESQDIIRKQEYIENLLCNCIENSMIQDKHFHSELMPKLPESFRSYYGFIQFSENLNNLVKLDNQKIEKLFPNLKLKCNHDYHYIFNDELNQNYKPRQSQINTVKTAQPYWICKSNLTDDAMKCHELVYSSMYIDPIFSLQTKFFKEDFRLKEINYMTVKAIEQNKLEPPQNELNQKVQNLVKRLIESKHQNDENTAISNKSLRQQILSDVKAKDEEIFKMQSVQVCENKANENKGNEIKLCRHQSNNFMNTTNQQIQPFYNTQYSGEEIKDDYPSSMSNSMSLSPQINPIQSQQTKYVQSMNLQGGDFFPDTDNNVNIFTQYDYTRKDLNSMRDEPSLHLASSPQSHTSSIIQNQQQEKLIIDYQIEKDDLQQTKSHNRSRLELAYLSSKMHWLQNNYDEKTKKDFENVQMSVDDSHYLKPQTGQISLFQQISTYLNAQIKIKVQNSQNQLLFEIERFWKSIVIPFLPPIFTNYIPYRYQKGKPLQKFHQDANHFLEAIVGYRLANNFQIILENKDIQQHKPQVLKEIKLIRGNYYQIIKFEDASQNITLIDHEKMKKKPKNKEKESNNTNNTDSIPSILYKFLIIDDKSGKLLKKQQLLQTEAIQDKLKNYDLLIGKNEEPSIQSIMNECSKKICLQISPTDSHQSKQNQSSIEKLKQNFENFLTSFRKNLLEIVKKNPDQKAVTQESFNEKFNFSMLSSYSQNWNTQHSHNTTNSVLNVNQLNNNLNLIDTVDQLGVSTSIQINNNMINYGTFDKNQYYEQTVYAKSFSNKEINCLDFFIVQFQKNWIPEGVFRIHIYWLSFPSSIISEFIKSINQLTRPNSLQMHYIQFINESIFRFQLGFDYSTPIKVLSQQILNELRDFIIEHDFCPDVTNPNTFLHFKGIGQVFLSYQDNNLLMKENVDFNDEQDQSDFKNLYQIIQNKADQLNQIHFHLNQVEYVKFDSSQ
ncbi:hypothetical protein ABPG74_004553 [Tetrahymena malaccensis]